jgi:predicted nucleic acid-binding protein
MLVLDASVAFWGCGEAERFERLGSGLVAPWLMWSECTSALRGAVWRRELSTANAKGMIERLAAAPVEPRTHPKLWETAFALAARLGWAKTYDAEYVALAQLLECRLVTLDGRLLRGAERVGNVIALSDL